MKLRVILSVLVFAMTVSTAYASFPVVRTVSTTAAIDNTIEEVVLMETPAAVVGDSGFVGFMLWLFLGFVAGHRWYYGSPLGWNILFILTLGGAGIWWIIDGIDIITGNYPNNSGFGGGGPM